MLAEPRAGHRDVARRVRTSASRTVRRARTWRRASLTSRRPPHTLSEGARVPAIRLQFAAALRIHRREVGVGGDHLVTQRLEAPRHPLAFCRGLDEDPRPRPGAQGLGEPAWLRPDPALEQFWLSFLWTSMPI